jgi:hypothetical protein
MRSAKPTPDTTPTGAPVPANTPGASATTKTAGSWLYGEHLPTQSASQSLPHGCGCGVRWAGYNTCHCASGCHETFTSPTAFDAHRNRRAADGGCLDPVTVGLVLRDRAGYAAWGHPSDEAANERMRTAREARLGWPR